MSRFRQCCVLNSMTDEQNSTPLVKAARTIGSTLGKVVSTVSGGKETQTAPPTKEKANLWQVENLGSGTFVIHKPKRKSGKRHRLIVRNRPRGMR